MHQCLKLSISLWADLYEALKQWAEKKQTIKQTNKQTTKQANKQKFKSCRRKIYNDISRQTLNCLPKAT